MKNSNIRYILAVVMLMATSAAVAQEMQSAYFVKDYLFRHDLNPALGNEKNYISFPALGNVNAEIRGNFGIGDVRDQGQLNGGAVRLDAFVQKTFNVIRKDPYRNLFVCVVAVYVRPYQRNKSYLGMSPEDSLDTFNVV